MFRRIETSTVSLLSVFKSWVRAKGSAQGVENVLNRLSVWVKETPARFFNFAGALTRGVIQRGRNVIQVTLGCKDSEVLPGSGAPAAGLTGFGPASNNVRIGGPIMD